MENVILVADDSPSIRKFISYALSLNGFKIIPACDGMEALEKLPLEKINLVITDLNMPNVDGFELIKAMRANEDYKDIPIIILSSLSGSAEIEEGISCGANSYLVKPFDPKKIIYEVTKYLN